MWLKKIINKSNNKKINNKFKKILLTTGVALGVTLGSVYADELENHLPKVFHVYIDGVHIGSIDNKAIVQEEINRMIDSADDTYKDLDLTVGEEVTFVPEYMFKPTYNNQSVVSRLKQELSLKIDGVRLDIDGQLIGYLESEAVAQEALDIIKEQFVTTGVLERINDPMYKIKESEVAVGESKIIDVIVSQNVSLTDEKIEPTEILTVKQAVKLLQKGTLEDKIHTIQQGEVLGQIAGDYNLSMGDVFSLNPGLNENSILQIGQDIVVTDYKPYIDVEVIEQKRVKEIIDYEIELEYSDDIYKGESKIKQQGQEGSKEVHFELKSKNGKIIEKTILSEEILKEPVTKIVVKGTKVIPSRGTGEFSWPTVGGTITSHLGWRWGAYHKGIDIAGVRDRSILAADNGVVTSAGWDNGGYGYKIIINHNNGYKTLYAHMSSLKVKVGQTVRKGQTIGVMGNTGHSTGTHLHFELHKNGSVQNPMNYY